MFRRSLSLVLCAAVAFAYATATFDAVDGADANANAGEGWGWTPIDEHLGPGQAIRLDGGPGRVRDLRDAKASAPPFLLRVATPTSAPERDLAGRARPVRSDRVPVQAIASSGRTSRGPPGHHVRAT